MNIPPGENSVSFLAEVREDAAAALVDPAMCCHLQTHSESQQSTLAVRVQRTRRAAMAGFGAELELSSCSALAPLEPSLGSTSKMATGSRYIQYLRRKLCSTLGGSGVPSSRTGAGCRSGGLHGSLVEAFLTALAVLTRLACAR